MAIRPVEPDDFDTVAALLTRYGPERVVRAELEDEAVREVPGKILRRWVAERRGRVVATAFAIQYPSQPEGVFNGGVVVERDSRRLGIGSALAAEVERIAVAGGGTELRTEAREDEHEGVEFARRRRFRVVRRAVRARLDLRTFEPDRFRHLVDSVAAAGIRLTSLADVGLSDETIQRLYEINRIATIDDPASLEGTFPSFETWRRAIVDGPGFQPEGQLLALDGDRFVALSAVTVDREEGVAETLVTGVDPAYRGRGIATALKVEALRLAREAEVPSTETETDERNGAMIAINRKLGYEPRPGYVVLAARLSPTRGG